MRIFCRVIGFVIAAYFILMAIAAFIGINIPNYAVGIFFALFSIEMISDSVSCFKKPLKTVKCKNLITFKDGTTQTFDSELSLKEKNGAHTTADVKSIYSEIAEDFDHE